MKDWEKPNGVGYRPSDTPCRQLPERCLDSWAFTNPGAFFLAMQRRIVEFHRNRDLYFVKHGMPLTRFVWRICWAWAYLVRAGVAALLPGHDPHRYLVHARQQLAPGRGEGIREAARDHNARLA